MERRSLTQCSTDYDPGSRCDVTAHHGVVVMLIALSTTAAAGGAASPGPRAALTDLESLQVTGLVQAMASVEQRLPKHACVRFKACVASQDPSEGIREHIHAVGYRAVRWCSQQDVDIPSHCRRATIDLLAPVNLAEPVHELVYQTSGAVSVRCRIRVEGIAGQYGVTTSRRCSEDRQ
jgi:hypothetical protein